MNKLHLNVAVAALLLLLALLPGQRGSAAAQSQSGANLPPATIANDEGGTTVITGTAGSANFAFMPDLWPNPSVVLIDVTNLLSDQPEIFVPKDGQILGLITESLFPGPGQFRINLPFTPTGATLDVDNDGEEDTGVQIFALQVASNLFNDSYLEQLEQVTGLGSYLTDVATGALTQGTFLVYASDGEQGFPSAIGEDGQWFTEDDPAAALPAGYTVATLTLDGVVTFDRSATGAMNTIERAEEASPDFSDQGILESFNSLIDVLAERYAWTELRGLDWEQIRQANLPQVNEADANDDIPAYYVLLDTLATSIADAHVAAVSQGNFQATMAKITAQTEQIGGKVGADVIAVTDEANPSAPFGDKVVVLSVGEDTPAAAAGWVPGTEIISINGEPPAARYADLPLLIGTGVEEVQRVQKAPFLLSFPLSETVTIGYRLPDASEVMTATMVAGEYDSAPTSSAPTTQSIRTPVTYEQRGDYAIVRWGDFISYIVPKLAVLEEALTFEQNRSSAGMILDLRGNSGGWAVLYETMASYFFTADKPMPFHVFDWSYYDAKVGDLVISDAPDYQLSAPRPELAYTGPLVILIDSACASACEYFTQHLQVTGRATVVGQSASIGAGGPIERVAMPGNIMFQYTMGRTTFAGTNEPNLEAKGVVPDVRVPVTLETELAKAQGEDPVLDAAIAELDRLTDPAAKLSSVTWQWTTELSTSGQATPIDASASYTLTFSAEGSLAIQADCNRANGAYTLSENSELTITIGPTTLAVCPGDSRGEDLLRLLGATSSITFDGEQLAILLSPESGTLGLLFEPKK